MRNDTLTKPMDFLEIVDFRMPVKEKIWLTRMKIKIMSWNVRGAGDSDKRKIIKALVRQFELDLICLQESKVQEVSMEIIKGMVVGRNVD